MKSKLLNDLAVKHVGDGKRPNLFFVSVGNQGVQLVTTDFEAAYEFWKKSSTFSWGQKKVEVILEDRSYGLIAEFAFISDLSKSTQIDRWERNDDSAEFRRMTKRPKA